MGLSLSARSCQTITAALQTRAGAIDEQQREREELFLGIHALRHFGLKIVGNSSLVGRSRPPTRHYMVCWPTGSMPNHRQAGSSSIHVCGS